MRIGIMSVAHLHADSYVHNLRAIPGVELVGIADEDTQRGQQFATQYGVRFFTTYQDLLTEKPEGVIVCSENANHASLVKLAAEAGVHVLCEKPLATTLEDAYAMIEFCKKAGVELMTAFPMRFSPPILEVKKALDAGSLGKIYGCNATNQGECPKHHRAWFVDKHLAGGGAVMDHTVHLTDLLRWFLGCEVVEVYAETNHILYAQETEVETGGLVMLTFENGTFASIDCSWSKPPYYPTWGGLGMEIIGENGFLSVDAFKQRMTVYRHSLQRPLYGNWGSDSDQAMINDFVAAIRDNREPSVTGYDGLKAVEVALAAYESAQLGQPIKLA